jgi:hypothetical protein
MTPLGDVLAISATTFNILVVDVNAESTTVRPTVCKSCSDGDESRTRYTVPSNFARRSMAHNRWSFRKAGA